MKHNPTFEELRRMQRERFDPSRLVELAREQRPDDPWLAESLAQCTVGTRESRGYIYFADPTAPEWVVQETVMLEDRKLGTVVVDLLEGHRIGGIEFVSRL